MKTWILRSLVPAICILATPPVLATQFITITNPTPAAGDLFGNSVASVGSGLVLVGTPQDDTGATDAGAAYLFNPNGILLTTFTNPTPASSDNFGCSVMALGTDKVLLGAYRDDTGTTDAGAAYLFSTNGTLLTTFTNPTPAASDFFGWSVAAVGTDKVLVGSFQDDTGAANAGTAYLFSTNGTLLTTFTNPTPAANDYFGRAVAGVGVDKVLIGAWRDDTAATDAGAAYLFSTNGTLLTTFTNPIPVAAEYFGYTLAGASSDKVIVGAYANDTGATDAGTAYLFSTNGALLTTFTNPIPLPSGYFAYAVAGVGSDKVLISAYYNVNNVAGAAYLYSTNGSLLTTITNPTPENSDYFGYAVAGLGNDRLLISASQDDTGATDTGTVYVYALESPLAVTLAASNVINDTATLCGTVNPNGLPTTVWFEWDHMLCSNLLFHSPPVAVGNGSAALPMNAAVSGLSPGIHYHCQMVASNSVGVTRGSRIAFWSPRIKLNLGASNDVQACGSPYQDPGAFVVDGPIAIAAGGNHFLALRADGTVAATYAQESGIYGETNVPPEATNVVAIAAGGVNSLALRVDGSIVAWGDNTYGQNNAPPSLTNAIAIAAGGSHSLAIRADHTVVGWGLNNYGQISIPAGATNVVAIAVGGAHSLAARADGSVIAWGDSSYGKTTVPANATNVIAVSAGNEHSVVLRADGTAMGWGNNIYTGPIPDPAYATNLMAIAAGAYHTVVLDRNGRARSWTSNWFNCSVEISGITNRIVAIAAAGDRSLGLRADNPAVVATGFFVDLINTNTPPGWPGGPEGCMGFTLGQWSVTASVPVSANSSVNHQLQGSYQLVYSATNILGGIGTATRTVSVSDWLPPVLTLAGSDALIHLQGTPFVDPGVSAYDACAGDLTGSIVKGGSVNSAECGIYTLTYSVTDPNTNSAQAIRTVLVANAPSITGTTGAVVSTNAGTGSRSGLLSVSVNPNGLTTTTFFQYGPRPAYWGGSAPVLLPGDFTYSNLNALVHGLLPGLTYHYRCVASNALGTASSPDQLLPVSTLFPAGDLNGDGIVDQSELDTVLANYYPTSLWLNITNTAGLGKTNISFALDNSTTGAYSVLMSTNLVDWEYLGPATPRYEFLDTNAPAQPQRYYRLRWP